MIAKGPKTKAPSMKAVSKILRAKIVHDGWDHGITESHGGCARKGV